MQKFWPVWIISPLYTSHQDSVQLCECVFSFSPSPLIILAIGYMINYLCRRWGQLDKGTALVVHFSTLWPDLRKKNAAERNLSQGSLLGMAKLDCVAVCGPEQEGSGIGLYCWLWPWTKKKLRCFLLESVCVWGGGVWTHPTHTHVILT